MFGLNTKEVITPKKGENFTFPIADGTVKLSEGDQVFRKSTLIREVRKDDLLEESDGSQSSDTMTNDSEVRNDSWSIEGNHIYRHHMEPRVKLYCA